MKYLILFIPLLLTSCIFGRDKEHTEVFKQNADAAVQLATKVHDEGTRAGSEVGKKLLLTTTLVSKDIGKPAVRVNAHDEEAYKKLQLDHDKKIEEREKKIEKMGNAIARLEGWLGTAKNLGIGGTAVTGIVSFLLLWVRRAKNMYQKAAESHVMSIQEIKGLINLDKDEVHAIIAANAKSKGVGTFHDKLVKKIKNGRKTSKEGKTQKEA